MTVWRSVSDPALLYLSTRPQGGRWRTEETPLDMSALSRSGRFHQSNAISVRVPLSGGGAVTVEVTVWRSVSDPTLLYLSTRPQGGRWRTVETPLDMSMLSASGRFHQSNAIRVEVEFGGTPSRITPSPTRTPAPRSSHWVGEGWSGRVFYTANQEGFTHVLILSDQGDGYVIGLGCGNNRLIFTLTSSQDYWYHRSRGGTTVGYHFGTSGSYIFNEWNQRNGNFFYSKYPHQMMERIRSESVLWIGLSDALDTEVRSFSLQGMTSTPAQGNLDRCGR